MNHPVGFVPPLEVMFLNSMKLGFPNSNDPVACCWAGQSRWRELVSLPNSGVLDAAQACRFAPL